jgi:hypothetical protein
VVDLVCAELDAAISGLAPTNVLEVLLVQDKLSKIFETGRV